MLLPETRLPPRATVQIARACISSLGYSSFLPSEMFVVGVVVRSSVVGRLLSIVGRRVMSSDLKKLKLQATTRVSSCCEYQLATSSFGIFTHSNLHTRMCFLAHFCVHPNARPALIRFNASLMHSLSYNMMHGLYGSSSSDLSLTSSSSLSSQPSASRFCDLIPKLRRNPRKAIPPNTPNASASPFGCIPIAMEKRPPERKGPAARPAAESVCARPFNVPKTAWFGEEFVICGACQ